jgi:hypothetical protein
LLNLSKLNNNQALIFFGGREGFGRPPPPTIDLIKFFRSP